MFQGQTGEIAPLNPGKLGLFLILVQFFHPSLPKIGHSTQSKTSFSNKYGTAMSSQKFRLDKLKITVYISNCKKNCSQLRFLEKPLKARGN